MTLTFVLLNWAFKLHVLWMTGNVFAGFMSMVGYGGGVTHSKHHHVMGNHSNLNDKHTTKAMMFVF